MFAFLIHAVISLFAVMNPLGIMPTFLSMTSSYTKEHQRQTATKAVLNSFLILLVFLLFGNFILNLFSITINAFRVAGGILLFGIAYDLLHAKASQVQTPDSGEELPRSEISITPLAIPIIAGPGTITTVMALAAEPNVMMHKIEVFAAMVFVLLMTYVIFYYSSTIHQRLSQSQLNVITRLMGFVLSIISIQMAATGLANLFPGLIR